MAARKSQLGGLWPYLDDHDVKHRTVEAADDSSNAAQGGDGESEDGGEWDLDGWDDAEDGQWETVVDLGEGEGGGSGIQRRGGGRRRRSAAPAPARPIRRGKPSKEDKEVGAMFEES